MVVFFKPNVPLFFSAWKMTFAIFSSVIKKFSSVLCSSLPLFVYNSKDITDKSPFNLFSQIFDISFKMSNQATRIKNKKGRKRRGCQSMRADSDSERAEPHTALRRQDTSQEEKRELSPFTCPELANWIKLPLPKKGGNKGSETDQEHA